MSLHVRSDSARYCGIHFPLSTFYFLFLYNLCVPYTPFSIRAFYVVSWLLGWLMTFDGLYQRIWNQFWPGAGVVNWAAMAGALGLTPAEAGWPLLVGGLCLVGASFGLYLRRSWGVIAGGLVCLLALSYFWLGSALAALGLVLLFWPTSRAYWQVSET